MKNLLSRLPFSSRTTPIDESDDPFLKWSIDFFQTHSQYEMAENQCLVQGGGGLNRVVRAKMNGRNVVLKHYSKPGRLSLEKHALEVFESICEIPRFIAVHEENTLAMDEITGQPYIDSSPEDRKSLRKLGRILANLSQTHLVESVVRTTQKISLCASHLGVSMPEEIWSQKVVQSRKVCEELPGFNDPIILNSVAIMEETKSVISRSKLSLVHYDVNPTNVLVNEGIVTGIVDLESCELGVPLIQIGDALGWFYDFKMPDEIPDIIAGWEEAMSSTIDRRQLWAVMASHFWNHANCWGYPGPEWPVWFTPIPPKLLKEQLYESARILGINSHDILA